MVKMKIVYEGDLHCHLTHEPSGIVIATDAPKDNQGRGGAFSPTDLLAAALGSCMLTIMGISARRHNFSIDGTKVDVEKEMASVPVRIVKKIIVNLTMPPGIPSDKREILDHDAHACPVFLSLNPAVEVVISIQYPD